MSDMHFLIDSFVTSALVPIGFERSNCPLGSLYGIFAYSCFPSLSAKAGVGPNLSACRGTTKWFALSRYILA